jgi:hypothetical protein
MKTTTDCMPAEKSMKTIEQLEKDYRETVAVMDEAQRRLGATPKNDPRREQLKADLAAAVDTVRTAKEAQKRAVQLRVFAGLTSPLHEAVVVRLDPAVAAELEADAIARQVERDRRGVERRAAKAAVAPPTPADAAKTPASPPQVTSSRSAPEIDREVPRAMAPAHVEPPDRRSEVPAIVRAAGVRRQVSNPEVFHVRTRAFARPVPPPSTPGPAQPSRPLGLRSEVASQFRDARRGR